jgi:hypothetical protein
MQAGEERLLEFRDAVVVGVAQQGDAVGTGHGRAGALHHRFHHRALDPADPALARRSVAFRDQHVAVGQDQQPARMLESAGETRERKSGGGGRSLACAPADRGGDVDPRDQAMVRRRERGIGAGGGGLGAAIGHAEREHAAAEGERNRAHGRLRRGAARSVAGRS